MVDIRNAVANLTTHLSDLLVIAVDQLRAENYATIRAAVAGSLIDRRHAQRLSDR